MVPHTPGIRTTPIAPRGGGCNSLLDLQPPPFLRLLSYSFLGDQVFHTSGGPNPPPPLREKGPPSPGTHDTLRVGGRPRLSFVYSLDGTVFGVQIWNCLRTKIKIYSTKREGSVLESSTHE